MKTLLITDSGDAKIGFRLAGIDAVLVNESDVALRVLKQAIEDDTTGLVLITDQLAQPIYDDVMDLKLSAKQTMVLTIPDPGGDFVDHIGQYVRESIGIKY